MLKKLLFPLIFGLCGLVVLLSLGTWQIQRLAWKNNLIGDIKNSIRMAPKEIIPSDINPTSQYLSTKGRGYFLEEELHILHSLKPYGPGFKLIKPFKLLSGETILVDLGYIREKDKTVERHFLNQSILGNILFPNETDKFTPQPNFQKNIWFSRNLGAMSDYLGTMPILIVLSSSVNDSIVATPLSPNLTNNHLQYAITWFCMAIGWGFMSIYLVLQVIRKYNRTGGKNAL